ncbi:non-ribosomal peptide synthetase, partial [Planktothrix sp. FACHB-1355]|uniref:condensation domain-containing protein n=1 Tax=Planktothrix sp. FACHB-1355 TaxID=2692854 RepID=UPI0019A96D25
LLLDGWSVPILLREVFLCYESFCRGDGVPSLPAARPFRDYIGWLERQDLQEAESYWRETLGGTSGATVLAKRNGAAGAGAVRSAEERVRLTKQRSEQVRAFGQREKVTVNTIVQGAWALVLSGISQEREVLFGATVSGRPAELAGAGEMVGLFINTLPVRVRVRAGEERGRWLRELQSEQIKSREFEYSPLWRIRQWAGLGADRQLFESILVFENYPIEEVVSETGKALKVSKFMYLDPPQSELLLMVVPGNEILFRLLYSPAIYTPETVRGLLTNLESALFSLVEEGRARLGEIGFVRENIRTYKPDEEIEKSLFHDEFAF